MVDIMLVLFFTINISIITSISYNLLKLLYTYEVTIIHLFR